MRRAQQDASASSGPSFWQMAAARVMARGQGAPLGIRTSAGSRATLQPRAGAVGKDPSAHSVTSAPGRGSASGDPKAPCSPLSLERWGLAWGGNPKACNPFGIDPHHRAGGCRHVSLSLLIPPQGWEVKGPPSLRSSRDAHEEELAIISRANRAYDRFAPSLSWYSAWQMCDVCNHLSGERGISPVPRHLFANL